MKNRLGNLIEHFLRKRGSSHCLGSTSDQRYNHYQQTMSHFSTSSPAAAAFYPGVAGSQHGVYGSNGRHRDQQALNYQALSHSHYPSHHWPSQNVSSHNYPHLDPRQQMMAAASDQRYSQMSRYPMAGHGSSWPPGITHQQLAWPHGSGQDPSSIMRSLAASSSVNSSNPHFPGLRFPSSSQVTNTQLHGWSSHHRSSSNSSTSNNHPPDASQSASFNHNVPYQSHRESNSSASGTSSSTSSSRRQSSNHQSGLTASLLNTSGSVNSNPSSDVTSRGHCGWRSLNGGNIPHHPSGPGSTHSESSSNHSTSPFGVLPHQELSQVAGPGSISSGYYSSSASSTGSAPPSCMVAAYGHVGHNGLSGVPSTNPPVVAITGGETNPNLSGVIPEEIEFPAIVSNFPSEPYTELRLDPSAAGTSSSRTEKRSKSDRTKKKLEKRKNKEKSKEIEKADQVAASLFLQSMNPLNPLNPFEFMNGQHGYPPFHHSKDPNPTQSLSHHHHEYHHHLMPPNASFNNPHHPLYPSQHYPPHPMMNGDITMNSSNLLSSHMQSQSHVNGNNNSSNKSSHNHSHSQTPSHSSHQHDHDSQSPHGSVASSHASSMDHSMDKSLQQTPVQSQVMSQQQTLIHQIHDQSQSSHHGSLTPHPSLDVPDKSQVVPSPQLVMSTRNFPHQPELSSVSAPSSVNGSRSEGGGGVGSLHEENDKESTFAELEDDLRLLTEGTSDCSSSNMILVPNQVSYTPPNQDFNKSCLNSSSDNSLLLPSQGNDNSEHDISASNSRPKQPSLAETDPDFKKILDFIPDTMDVEVIEHKIEPVQTSPVSKRSSASVDSGMSTDLVVKGNSSQEKEAFKPQRNKTCRTCSKW